MKCPGCITDAVNQLIIQCRMLFAIIHKPVPLQGTPTSPHIQALFMNKRNQLTTVNIPMNSDKFHGNWPGSIMDACSVACVLSKSGITVELEFFEN